MTTPMMTHKEALALYFDRIGLTNKERNNIVRKAKAGIITKILKSDVTVEELLEDCIALLANDAVTPTKWDAMHLLNYVVNSFKKKA